MNLFTVSVIPDPDSVGLERFSMFKFTDPWKTILRVVDVLSEVERRVSQGSFQLGPDSVAGVATHNYATY